MDLIPTMLADGATWWQSLIRTAAGVFLLGLPLALSARLGGRLLARGSAADRLSAHITVGWSQAVVSFELLGSFHLLSLQGLGVCQWLMLGAWYLASQWSARRQSHPPLRHSHERGFVCAPRARKRAEGHPGPDPSTAGTVLFDHPSREVGNPAPGPSAAPADRPRERGKLEPDLSASSAGRPASERENLGPDPSAAESGSGAGTATPPPGSPRIGGPPATRKLSVPALLLVAGLCLLPWIRQLSIPPVMADTLNYHLVYPAEWLSSGELRTLVPQQGDPARAFYPFSGEVLLGLSMALFGTDQFAVGSAILCLPAILLALLAIAEALGLSARSAVLSWALFCTSPLVLWLTMVGFSDLPLAAAAILALKSAVLLVSDRSARRAGETGAALGLVVGVKYTGLLLGVGVVLVVVAALVRAWRSEGPRRMAVLALTIGLAGGLVGGYPYARNLYLTGSPVYPAGVDVLGFHLFDGAKDARWDRHSTFTEERQFRAPKWEQWLTTSEGVSTTTGLPVLLFLLPASVLGVALLSRKRGVAGALAGASGWIGLGVFLLASPYQQNPRYYVPQLSLLLVAILPIFDAILGKLGRAGEGVVVSLLWLAFIWCNFELSRGLDWVLALVIPMLWMLWHRNDAELGATDPPRLRTGETSRATATTGWRLAWAGVGVLLVGLALAQPSYLATKYGRWEKLFGDGRGFIFSAVNRLSADRGLTVAIARTPNGYPWYGSDLRNRVLYVPKNDNVDAYVYGLGHPFESVTQSPDQAAWLSNLTALKVDVLAIGANPGVEHAWIESNPQRFTLLERVKGYSLYLVRH